MKVTSISLKNIGRIDELEIKPGTITRITGRNGSGKTSALNGVLAALDAPSGTLVRNGEQEGEVVIVFDDGADGLVIDRKIPREGKSTLTITDKNGKSKKGLNKTGKIVDAGQPYLDAFMDALSVNPVEFLLAKPEKRVEELLKMVSLEFTPQQLETIKKLE